MPRRHYAAFPITSVKADDGEAGTFEAIVSVFGNVDYAGDRILEGAFANSLERWKASGDPIPVIWSHQWHDPAAYIGSVDPSNIEELPAGSDDLPDSIREFGGLRIKADLDTDDPNGAKVAKLLKSRVVREFSFAYDVIDEAKNEDDNINELLEIDLIEVGPTLKGANPLTELVGAKAFDEAFARVAATLDTDSDTLAEFKAALEAEVAGITVDLGPAADELDAKALEDLADIIGRLEDSLAPAGFKVAITAIGLKGERLAALLNTLIDDAATEDRPRSEVIEAMADAAGISASTVSQILRGEVDCPPLSRLEGFASALGVGVGRLTTAAEADGCDYGDDASKSAKAGARNSAVDGTRIQQLHDLTGELGADCKAEDPEKDDAKAGANAGGFLDPATLAAHIDADLIELTD